jgi:hypothetical protein
LPRPTSRASGKRGGITTTRTHGRNRGIVKAAALCGPNREQKSFAELFFRKATAYFLPVKKVVAFLKKKLRKKLLLLRGYL